MSDYYNENAARFFRQTVGVDMEPLRERFLEDIPPGGHVLDAGCGSGRDSKAFMTRGYQVTAFDASAQLAELAGAYLGNEVRVLRFQEIEWTETFDGVWACASLLHVPRRELPSVLTRLGKALKPGGVMYVSFKYGTGEHVIGNRTFTNLDEPSLNALVAHTAVLEIAELWTNRDRRVGHTDEWWLNALLRKA